VQPEGSHDWITRYTARVGDREQIHGTTEEKLTVMNSFGRRGWRLKLVDELNAPADTDKQTKTLESLSDIERMTGTPGTVVSLTQYFMSRRLK
jgi:hypothetical protein